MKHVLQVALLCFFISTKNCQAENFKGGRDIAMAGIGALNVSLLVMIIVKSIEKPKQPVTALNQPLRPWPFSHELPHEVRQAR